MGVSGTTLMDVLAGRKTSGTIKGDIRIGRFPKEFVKEVLEIIEFDEIKDCLVGVPSVSGLSTEQRKRLTIDMELVANPSIIFMDEPTTALDVIYSGPLGQHSSSVIEYFEVSLLQEYIKEQKLKLSQGVQKIRNNYNPATWMLEITSSSAEAQLSVDFAKDTVLRSREENVFWYFYAMFCTFLYFTYLGMLFVALTPTFPVAASLQAAFYTMLSLFSGYLMPHLVLNRGIDRGVSVSVVSIAFSFPYRSELPHDGDPLVLL
ncbi:hypothetical protein HYC85_001964 [Camellia sinensis]|uniref:ABC-2 type transporter transmembrane domain-containing protein n=1 Tax=Camellia sinensis TaxID=4442 RepID=A0A7J7I7F6_CAMSI|nr:hypothetical protein HYC85_001964 [Camellia sinensis]